MGNLWCNVLLIMISLNAYIGFLQSIVEENKEMGEMPVAYSIDDEGNGFKMINSQPVPCQIDDINEYNLEMVGYYNGDDDDEISKENVNCIIIN